MNPTAPAAARRPPWLPTWLPALAVLLSSAAIAAPAQSQRARPGDPAAKTLATAAAPSDPAAFNTRGSVPSNPLPLAPQPAVPPKPTAPAPQSPATAGHPAPDPSGGPGHRDDAAANPASRRQEPDRPDCALGIVCVGPVLNLGVINPIGAGVHARVGDHLGFGIDYQILPTVVIQGADTSASLLTVDARVYPFAGAFFLSGGIAVQSVRATASARDFGPVPAGYRVDVAGAVDIPMLKFGLGFFGRGGLVLGIDLAVGVPLTGTDVQLDADYQGLGARELAQAGDIEDRVRDDVQGAVDSVLDVMPVLFQVNLIRLGYVF